MHYFISSTVFTPSTARNVTLGYRTNLQVGLFQVNLDTFLSNITAELHLNTR